jgi:all-trans-retinol 13,14-reductase
MKYDHVIIGSGMSGMACAIILARQGARVAVVEQASGPAPLLRGFQRQGIHFDTGFHYSGCLGHGEVLDTYFRYLGISDALVPVAYDMQGFDVVRFQNGGFSFAFPQGLERIRTRLHEAFPREKQAIDIYLQTVVAEFARSAHLNLDIPVADMGAFNPLHEQSVAAFLTKLSPDARLRAVLGIHYLLYGVEPAQASMALHAQVCGSMYQSVHGLRGGGRALATALTRRLAQLGVELFCGCRATRVMAEAGQCRGVELDSGQSLAAPGCISSIHPRALLGLVGQDAFRPATRRRIQAFEDTTSGFMFSARLDKLPSFLQRGNVFLCPDYDLDTYCRPDRPVEARPFFLAAARAVDGAARQGMIMLCPGSIQEMQPWADSTAQTRPESYQAMKQELMHRVRAHVRAAIPEIGDPVMLDCATPLTFRDWTGAPSGCLYGIKHKHGQIAPSALTKIKGLYLSGQALTGPGILGATISAFLTCGFILGPENLRMELDKCR